MRVADTLLVSGTDVRDDKRFLPDPYGRPYQSVDPKLVRSLVGLPSHTVRNYLTLRVVDWRGELVLSIFVRFHRVRWNLFIEASYFVLPSLKSVYHLIDGLSPHPSMGQNFSLLVKSLFPTFPRLFLSPLRIAKDLWKPIKGHLSDEGELKEIRDNPLFNYGATTTIRQAGTSAHHAKYFQRIDKDMYLKSIERRLLEEIAFFLDSMNVDTGELRQSSQVILNNGVMVTGGSVTAQSIAAGQSAMATVKNLAGTVWKAAGK